MSDPILYLMSKYTGREVDSLKENQDAWDKLDEKGLTCYSPICESHNIAEYRKSIGKYDHDNYVARDLRLLESWCCFVDDYGMVVHSGDIDDWEKLNYQPKVVGVVLPSAYHYEPDHILYEKFQSLVWDSKGAKAEYEFMQSHHILVISLETALTIPPEQWREHGL